MLCFFHAIAAETQNYGNVIGGYDKKEPKLEIARFAWPLSTQSAADTVVTIDSSHRL